jgi:hypothetical protein
LVSYIEVKTVAEGVKKQGAEEYIWISEGSNNKETGINFLRWNFIVCAPRSIFWRLNPRGYWHTWERKEVHSEFRLESMKKRNHLEDVEVDGRMILK